MGNVDRGNATRQAGECFNKTRRLRTLSDSDVVRPSFEARIENCGKVCAAALGGCATYMFRNRKYTAGTRSFLILLQLFNLLCARSLLSHKGASKTMRAMGRRPSRRLVKKWPIGQTAPAAEELLKNRLRLKSRLRTV